ncbi:galactokinase [candidate division KSB1 bacterium]|nr:galactokinase [candidate division KSB1 bacterium]
MTRAEIIIKFNKHFKGQPRIFRAPGRVNLIGEHTDYNDGFVFPMAIQNYTTVAVAPRTDRLLSIWSENMQELTDANLDFNTVKRGHWSDYTVGIAVMIEREDIKLTGADIYIESNVPVGAGLSSSAALEISSALALLSTVNAGMEKKHLAKLGQRAENQFVGMNCGIMDQFISVHGEQDKALFLDCRTLEYKLVPLPSDKVRIVICNTMVKHELGSSEYNKRRSECETGVKIMSVSYENIRALRDVSLEQFNRVKEQLPPVVRQRCRHVISEDERTIESIDALQKHDLVRFGQLMNASHDSLRDDYQVSCRELDIMVDIARKIPGVLGARMTGGGFGGCTVNLVEKDNVDLFCEQLISQYKKATDIDAKIYISSASRGAHEVI